MNPQNTKEAHEQKKVEAHAAICSKLTDIYRKKNHDYGDAFSKTFRDYGMMVSCIRIEDKLNRLKSLTKVHDRLVTEERIEDTLMDLANYAIMTLIELNKPKK